MTGHVSKRVHPDGDIMVSYKYTLVEELCSNDFQATHTSIELLSFLTGQCFERHQRLSSRRRGEAFPAADSLNGPQAERFAQPSAL